MPCQNEATCHDGVNTYRCECAAGLTGTHCETGVYRDSIATRCVPVCHKALRAERTSQDNCISKPLFFLEITLKTYI